MKIRIEASVRYPDTMGICEPTPGSATAASNPTVAFEVLNPNTARKDLDVRNAEYQTLASLRRYVALHQDAAAEVFFRDAEAEWSRAFVAAPGALTMPEIGVDLPLAEIYDGLAL